MIYWNIRLVDRLDDTGRICETPAPLSEMPEYECIDVSLGVKMETYTYGDDKATISVFMSKRDVDIEKLSVFPRFEHVVNAVYLDSMDDVKERVNE